MPSMTDAEILEQYKLARDRIVTAIADGEDTVEYQIGSRRVRRSECTVALREVEKMIAYYQTRSDAGSYGRARNYVQFHRR